MQARRHGGTLTWHPSSWYANLSTKARVDVRNAVDEKDESNNELAANVQVVRGFMSFDLAGIPETARVQSIQLRFHQVNVTGTPYAKLGNPLMQHVDYGSSLSNAAFDAPVLRLAILSPHTGPDQWYNITSMTVGDWIKSDLAAGRTRFQLRLQFSTETDGDGQQDTTHFESGDNYLGTGNMPQLTITYWP